MKVLSMNNLKVSFTREGAKVTVKILNQPIRRIKSYDKILEFKASNGFEIISQSYLMIAWDTLCLHGSSYDEKHATMLLRSIDKAKELVSRASEAIREFNEKDPWADKEIVIAE